MATSLRTSGQKYDTGNSDNAITENDTPVVNQEKLDIGSGYKQFGSDRCKKGHDIRN